MAHVLPALALAATLVAGGLDPGFGRHGEATVDTGAVEQATAVAVQPDGKILVEGFYDDVTPLSPCWPPESGARNRR